MQDKTFELLEKIYAEFSSRFDKVDNRLDRIEGRLDGVEDRLGIVEDRLDKVESRLDRVEGHITHIEIEHGKKLDALFDGYTQLFEKLHEHDKRFNSIELKVDNLSIKVGSHDSKLAVLEGGRKK